MILIYDHVTHTERYRGLNPDLDKALEYLRSHDLSRLEPGKYFIDGSTIFFMIQEMPSVDKEQARWEAHQKYIDIQFLISGVESIGFQKTNAMIASVPYDAEKDIGFYQDNGEGFFVPLLPGHFVICFPDDAHMPLIGENRLLKKAVFKIRVA